MDYGKIEWDCDSNSVTSEFFSINRNSSISPSFSYRFSKHFVWQILQMFLSFQTFSICFLRLIQNIQIGMYRNLDFLVKSKTVADLSFVSALITAQKSFLRIWSNLLKKSLMEKFIFGAVSFIFFRHKK